MKRKSILLILFFPFWLATTYIVQEKGVEVGRFIDQDGRDERKTINGDLFIPDSSVSERAVLMPKQNLERAYQNQIEREKAYWRLVHEQQQDWGIKTGMTRAEVEKIAQEKHVPLFSKYS